MTIAHRNSIVLITVDCLRADHLGCYGYDRRTSPNINEFAESATVFEHGYANCPGTRWTFQSLHTGQPTSAFDGLGIPEDYQPLASHFKEAGYFTGGFAVNGFVSRDYRFDTGFDTYYSIQDSTEERSPLNRIGKRIDDLFNSELLREYMLSPIHDFLRSSSRVENNRYQPSHSDEDTVDAALSFISAHSKEPFFLWVHLMDAHTPYGYWPNHLEKLRGDSNITHTIHPGQENRITVGEAPPQEVVDTYDAGIRSVDEQIGRLLHEIDDGTVIITGDHGEEFGRYGNFHEASLYSSMTQVPFIVQTEGLEVGRSEMPMQHLDIPPTLLRSGGIEVPPEWASRPIQDLDRRKDEPIFFTLGPDNAAVRVGEWKLICQEQNNKLYQISHSGSEGEPSQNQEKLKQLKHLIDEFQAGQSRSAAARESLDSGQDQLSDEVKNNLDDLGYL